MKTTIHKAIQLKIGKKVISCIEGNPFGQLVGHNELTKNAEAWLDDRTTQMYRECRKNSHSRVFSYRHCFIG